MRQKLANTVKAEQTTDASDKTGKQEHSTADILGWIVSNSTLHVTKTKEDEKYYEVIDSSVESQPSSSDDCTFQVRVGAFMSNMNRSHITNKTITLETSAAFLDPDKTQVAAFDETSVKTIDSIVVNVPGEPQLYFLTLAKMTASE